MLENDLPEQPESANNKSEFSEELVNAVKILKTN